MVRGRSIACFGVGRAESDTDTYLLSAVTPGLTDAGPGA